MSAPEDLVIVKDLHDAIGKDDVTKVTAILQNHKAKSKELCSTVIPKVGTALHHCARRGKLELTKLVHIESGIDINFRSSEGLIISGEAPLHEAVTNGHLDVVDYFLQQKADVNIVDSEGHTPLHCACLSNKTQIVERLLQAGANVNLRDTKGVSCLQMAILRSPDDITRLLVDNGGDVHILDKEGQSPLHYASEWNNVDLIDILVQKGANINLQDKEGRSPAHVTESDDVKKHLGSLGADLRLRDKRGKPVIEEQLDMEKEEYKNIDNALSRHTMKAVKRASEPVFDYQNMRKFQAPTPMVDSQVQATKAGVLKEMLRKRQSAPPKATPMQAHGVLDELKSKTKTIDQ